MEKNLLLLSNAFLLFFVSLSVTLLASNLLYKVIGAFTIFIAGWLAKTALKRIDSAQEQTSSAFLSPKQPK